MNPVTYPESLSTFNDHVQYKELYQCEIQKLFLRDQDPTNLFIKITDT